MVDFISLLPLSFISMICAWSWISLQTQKTSVLLFIQSFLFICFYVQFILIFMKYEFRSIYGALNDICQLFWSYLHINTMYCIVNSCSYIEDHTTELILFVAAISFVLLELMFHWNFFLVLCISVFARTANYFCAMVFCKLIVYFLYTYCLEYCV
jgi:hypothetical protein